MTLRIGIAGASGYVGGELMRVLSSHPEAELAVLAGNTSAGSMIGEHHPHLVQLADRKIVALEPEAFDDCDVVFLALPHGKSAELAGQLKGETLVLDCGADFRLADPSEWQTFYGSDHAGSWPYGLPELPGARGELKGAKRIAVPGCYPTASALAMWPALANGLVEHDIVIVAASGTSGAGRSLKSNLLGSEVMGAMSAYGVGGMHRHTPEIRQVFEGITGERMRLSFTPTLAPMPRGILATCSAPVKDGITESAFRLAYEHSYGDEPFVHLLPRAQWPSTASVLGSNAAHVQVTVDEDAQRLIAISAIDNLTKGTAGQATQCMNIALGLPETTGLSAIGLAP
jgi:N-acetyl-gamma-glutamyl-phosphate reductase